MSDEAPDSTPQIARTNSPSGEFIAVWAQSITQVLTQIAGSALSVESLPEIPAEAPASGDGDIQAMIVAAGGLRGEMALRLPRAAALALAQLFLGEPQEPAAESKPEHKEAVEELLRQIAGQVATALRPRWGEVQLHLEAAGAPSWSAATNGWLKSASDTPCPLWIEWQLSAALQAALEAATAPAQEPSQPAPQAESTLSPGTVVGNLDLLMDVELEVMLRFGERNMKLQEILELGAGSVVELDRRIEEPADLLLDGRIIARGEVVVVDGNYGLRVLEIAGQPPANPIVGR